MKNSRRLVNFALVTIAVIVVALPIFWIEGGIGWLETKVFPPRRPRSMPLNSVWINAPTLPISWHHGWWFGCSLSSSGAANYCRLVGANGEMAYGGNYLPCINHPPIDEGNIRLMPPPRGASMWLFGESNDGVIGFLANGDLLLPVFAQDKCGQVRARLFPSPR